MRGRTATEEHRKVIDRAVRAAGTTIRERQGRAALTALRSVLVLQRNGAKAVEFVLRWQQLTGAVTAKGVEDTALFVDTAFVARNDVGTDPGAPPAGLQEVHKTLQTRARSAPAALSATSTHDSKWSEDVRARLWAIAEAVPAWRGSVKRWTKLAGPLRREVDGEPAPDATELLLLFQTLLGVWPAGDGTVEDLAERVESFLRKAAREAKVHTSWTEPDEKYEDALATFVQALFGREGEPLRSDLEKFRRKIETTGVVAALSQALVKLAGPGVPDVYRGAERWFLRMVDPDNRAPVDLHAESRALDSLPTDVDAKAAKELLRTWSDGRIKLHVTRAALALRRAAPELFTRGTYTPLTTSRDRADEVFGFARRSGQRWALVVTPRPVAAGSGEGKFPLGRRAWGDATVTLPTNAPTTWWNALTGEELVAKGRALPLADVFGTLPVSLATPAG